MRHDVNPFICASCKLFETFNGVRTRRGSFKRLPRNIVGCILAFNLEASNLVLLVLSPCLLFGIRFFTSVYPFYGSTQQIQTSVAHRWMARMNFLYLNYTRLAVLYTWIKHDTLNHKTIIIKRIIIILNHLDYATIIFCHNAEP